MAETRRSRSAVSKQSEGEFFAHASTRGNLGAQVGCPGWLPRLALLAEWGHHAASVFDYEWEHLRDHNRRIQSLRMIATGKTSTSTWADLCSEILVQAFKIYTHSWCTG